MQTTITDIQSVSLKYCLLIFKAQLTYNNDAVFLTGLGLLYKI